MPFGDGNMPRRTPGRRGWRLGTRDLFEQRWAAWLERGDPFYSPHLTRTREDAGLEWGDVGRAPAAARDAGGVFIRPRL